MKVCGFFGYSWTNCRLIKSQITIILNFFNFLNFQIRPKFLAYQYIRIHQYEKGISDRGCIY